MHWLQYSGAIWYPMVYDEPREQLMQQAHAKVASQFARSLKYVSLVNARVVVPSAGPPCFLDEDLFHFNMITGDELSIRWQ
jgi:UDP-MurNAc hydroxylase